MASYFNKTRGIVTVSLRTGEPAMVGPKKVLVVTPEQDRSPSLLSRVRKGLLARMPDKPAPASTGAASQTQEQIEAPFAPEVPPEEEAPSLKWTKRRLAEYAEDQGLELLAGCTKVEILEAIEGAG